MANFNHHFVRNRECASGLVETLVSAALVGIVVVIGLQHEHFKSIMTRKLKSDLDYSALSQYLSAVIDCANTAVATDFFSRCQSNSSVDLFDKSGTKIIDRNGTTLSKYRLTNKCNGGLISVFASESGGPTIPLNYSIPIFCPAPARCLANSFNLQRVGASCTATLTKAPGSGDVDMVKINNIATSGTWSGNTWTATNYSCGTGAAAFSAALSSAPVYRAPMGSVNMSDSSCGSVTLPAAGPPELRCTIPSGIRAGVEDLLMGGLWLCQTYSRTIPDAIVLPTDAYDIKIAVSEYRVDDWNPCTSINGQIIDCNRSEQTFCSIGGPGPRVSSYYKDISSLLHGGSNSLYVESYNKHTYWSMWIGITGTYSTRQPSCQHSFRLITN